MNEPPKKIYIREPGATQTYGTWDISKSRYHNTEYIHISPEQKEHIAKLIDYHDNGGTDHALVASDFCTIVEELLEDE